jgi:hypothetical protein
MALSAPPNYQHKAKEIPLYGDIDSEEKTPKTIPRAKKGTPLSSDSRSGESKSPDSGSATFEGEPDENYSGLALTQLGSTSTPEQFIIVLLLFKEPICLASYSYPHEEHLRLCLNSNTTNSLSTCVSASSYSSYELCAKWQNDFLKLLICRSLVVHILSSMHSFVRFRLLYNC